MTPGTAVEIARAGAAVATLVVPARMARLEAGAARPLPSALLRVLGTRQLLQAGVLWDAGGPGHRLGALVDGLHAVSMAAVAAASGRYRRAAATQTAIATGFLLVEVVSARLSR